MSITQQQIARSLGIDQKTVSIAFGAAGRISPETRQRVLTAAREMGYRPNRLAAGLRGAATRSIGVMWPFVDRWVGDDVIGLEILHRLQNRGFATYQSHPAWDISAFCRQLDDLLERRVDAIVMQEIPSRLRHSEIVARLRHGPAVVAVSREDVEEFAGDMVIHDRNSAIRQAVDHLAKTGRKRPCMVTSMAEESNPPKYKAFWRQCKKHGIADHPHILIDMDLPDSPETHGQLHLDSFKRAFPRKIGVDAIFCFNDIGALTLMREIQDRGLRVPEDIAVIGFNNMEAGKLWRPPLATGDRRHSEVAQAVEQIIQTRLQNPELPPLRQKVSMQFVWRESAG